MKRRIFLLILTTLSFAVIAQPKEIPLYKNVAPGSETWTWSESVNNQNRFKVMTVYNVVKPTLTVFTPTSKSSKTAIIIAPGGGFHFLAIDHEGTNPAKIFAKKGITVFVLKYRTVHVFTDNPFDDGNNVSDQKAYDDEALPVIPLATDDGRNAIAYVRSHAVEYGIDVHRIGIMGFSAGGRIAAASAFEFVSENKPDFVASVYGDMPESLIGDVTPETPPLFIACAMDDDFGFQEHAQRVARKWKDAHRPCKLLLPATGGHGFGVGSASNATHNWLDVFTDWLSKEGFL